MLTAITRDNKILSFHNTHNEAFAQLLRIQSSSTSHAIKYEGYDIVECDSTHKTKEEIFACKFCNAILDSFPKVTPKTVTTVTDSQNDPRYS